MALFVEWSSYKFGAARSIVQTSVLISFSVLTSVQTFLRNWLPTYSGKLCPGTMISSVVTGGMRQSTFSCVTQALTASVFVFCFAHGDLSCPLQLDR